MRHVFGLIATGLAIFVWVALLLFFITLGLSVYGTLLAVLALGLLYGWMVTAFIHYRLGRQDEFLHLLATVVSSGTPLAPALWAYLGDRPQTPWRQTWVFFLLLFVVPGFYWFRHRRHNYDSKVARVAHRLDSGYALSEALADIRGVVPAEAVLAAAIGEATGRLGQCLRGAAQPRLGIVWVELLPRLVYPIVLLLFLVNILILWFLLIVPRMEMIFREFGTVLPAATEQVMDLGSLATAYALALVLNVFFLIGLVIAFVFSSYLRWYFPGVGRLYQQHVQGRVLQLLSIVLATQKPIPQAVDFLVQEDYGPALVRNRLRTLRHRIEQGHDLADALHGCGLLPGSMVPLVHSAQRVGNLPWALAELGQARTNRLLRILSLGSTLLSPVVILAIGLLVGFIVKGMFLPLVKLLEVMA